MGIFIKAVIHCQQLNNCGWGCSLQGMPHTFNACATTCSMSFGTSKRANWVPFCSWVSFSFHRKPWGLVFLRKEVLAKDTQEEVILMIDIMMRTGTAEAPVHKQPRQTELSGEMGIPSANKSPCHCSDGRVCRYSDGLVNCIVHVGTSLLRISCFTLRTSALCSRTLWYCMLYNACCWHQQQSITLSNIHC